VAVVGEEGHEEIIAVGRYTVESDTNMAEVAFLVRDDWQRKGIGTWLQNYLIETAKSRGIAALKARTLADNTAVLRLVHKAGVTIESTPEEGGLYLLTYKF
jgi:GNAT superfamily N-acetyltransferase